MNAVIVYESLWGNTAAVAWAIAEGIEPQARVLSTAQATTDALAGVDLLVAGAPILAFSLPTEKVREGIRANPGRAPAPPDLSHPSMRSWLEALAEGHGWAAAFDTRLRGPFVGSAASAIARELERAGYSLVAKPMGFLVKGKYGPLHDGQLERARLWGAGLAKSLG